MKFKHENIFKNLSIENIFSEMEKNSHSKTKSNLNPIKTSSSYMENSIVKNIVEIVKSEVCKFFY